MTLGRQKLERRFPTHTPLDQEYSVKKNTVAELYRDFAMYMDGCLPDGRLKSLTMTKLEEAHMFASKAIDSEADSASRTEENTQDD